MTPRGELTLAHHHPGRLRVRSEVFRGQDREASAHVRFDRVHAVLLAMSGVRAVHLNGHSGSILVEYEPGAHDPNELLQALASAADLDLLPATDALRPRPAWVAIGAARDLNTLIDALTGGRADLRELVSITLTGLAAYSFVVKKDRLPRWDNLAYWAFALFQSLHAAEIAEGGDRAP